jgi:hypothetical protein
MPRFLAMLALAASLLFIASPVTASADDKADFDVNGGHFYTQTNGSSDGPRAGGFWISDANGIPFWTFFNQQGGTNVLGYPVSTRFLWDGYVCQATQRAILQWNASTGQVQLVNLYDYLSGVGQDEWLWSRRLAPKPRLSAGEAANPQSIPFLQLAHLRFNWLYQDPPIFQRYFSTPGYFSVYGLPTSPVEDLGQYYAVRFQRAVLYHWKSTVPWADRKGVSVGLGGDLFKELGLIPSDAVHPRSTNEPDSQLSPLPEITSLPQVQGSTLTMAPPVTVPAAATAPAPVPGLPVLVGVATWYGDDFQGRPMYNGVPYNMNDPTTTAANLYPIGTWLRVTRLSTGQSIIVQVTDRGAFRYPDIVDLSYAAFAQLADPATGTIAVRVEPVSGP